MISSFLSSFFFFSSFFLLLLFPWGWGTMSDGAVLNCVHVFCMTGLRPAAHLMGVHLLGLRPFAVYVRRAPSSSSRCRLEFTGASAGRGTRIRLPLEVRWNARTQHDASHWRACERSGPPNGSPRTRWAEVILFVSLSFAFVRMVWMATVSFALWRCPRCFGIFVFDPGGRAKGNVFIRLS